MPADILSRWMLAGTQINFFPPLDPDLSGINLVMRSKEIYLVIKIKPHTHTDCEKMVQLEWPDMEREN